MSRFFTEPKNIGDKYITITDKSDIKHLAKVLRLKVGDKVDVSDSVQWEYGTIISEISQDEVLLEIESKEEFAREPEIYISLFQGIPKAGKMETIIQKAVELGVSEIVPVFMERTVVVDKGNFSKKLERWQKISNEAVKQCKRGKIPEVREQVKFKEAINQLEKENFDLVLFPYENEGNYSIKDCLKGLEKKPNKVAIIIGPEGGFHDKEVAALDEIGAAKVTLGKTILRTETAGMATIAMTMYELEL